MNLKTLATNIPVIVCAAAIASSAFAQTTQPALPSSGRASTQEAPSAKPPIAKRGLTEALRLNGLSTQELIERIQQRGVDFRLTPDDAVQFMEAGATVELVQAVRDNYRGSNQTQVEGPSDARVESNQPAQQPAQGADASTPAVSEAQAVGSPQPSNTPANPEAQPAEKPKKKSFLQKFNEKMEVVNQVLDKVDQVASRYGKRPSTGDPNAAPPAQTAEPPTTGANETQDTGASNAPVESDQPAQPPDASAPAATDTDQTDKSTRKAARAAQRQQGETSTNDGGAALASDGQADGSDKRAAKAGRQQADASPNDSAAPSRSSSAQSNLAGTSWSEMSITKKGETEKQSGTTPRFQFCRDRTWELYGYGGSAQGGTYQVQGRHLVMKYGDGKLFGDFQVTRNGNDMLLDKGEYVFRLR